MRFRLPGFSMVFLLVVCLVQLSGCGQEASESTQSTAQHETSGHSSASLAAFAGLEGTLDIAGGTAHIPVMNEAAETIMKAYPGIRISVTGGGSGVGVQKVGEGLVEIGNTGRPISDDEKQQYGLLSFPFAVDGVCVVVHPSNPINSLSSRQVQDIFSGTITNWQQVDGQDTAIHLFTRDEASGTRKVFWKKALAKGEILASANVVASNGAMKTAVAGDPAAIGYVSIGHLDDSLQAPALDGVEITQQSASDGTYRVVRKLYMNTRGEPGPIAEAFIGYILSPEGVEIVKAKGYLPIVP